ncbi:hypothetical protein BIY22_18865 [Vibrio panuliri]|uniref:Undecaprenyl-phosphate alpha-N-acetylglucosaminyl 1-phosphate transferase n=1 Tax=Vibrio panuliri TaxID=1381081 RepID=A0A1Q9HKM9_9VIBR|nr:hypothetical protein [Vibrio panuliri]OLQ90960.1 hypothetical protein BIY22_18865 [Vibrio panuliri]
MLIDVMFTFLSSLVTLFALRKLAHDYKWLDSPCSRKLHQGDIPLVGGVSVFAGVLVLTWVRPDMLAKQYQFICLALAFLAIGFFDDKYQLSAKFRLILMIALSYWIVVIEKVTLFYLGSLIGDGDTALTPTLAMLFTIAAIIASVTAFNMIDGLDGLLGVLSSVSLFSLFIVFHLAALESYALFCAGFIIAMLPYIACNVFSQQKHRVFMGDAGSALVGFTIVWLLLFATQPNRIVGSSNGVIKPVYVLWFIAIPLMDMVLVILKRAVRRQSLTCADRTHIHHLLLECGLSAKKVLLLLTGVSLCLAGVGLWCHFSATPQFVCLVVFVITFLFYSLANTTLEKHLSFRKAELGMV